MKLNTWTTSLFRLPIQIYFQHYLEIIVLFLILLVYRNLKTYKLSGIVPLYIGGIISDLICSNFLGKVKIPMLFIFEFFIFVFGVYLYPSLKKFRIEILVPLLAIDFIICLISYNYSLQGMHNLFITNLYYIIIAPFFFALFYKMVPLKNSEKILFIALVIGTLSFFIFEYFKGYHKKLSIPIIIFYVEHLAFSCFILARLTMDENNVRSLTEQPFFWICVSEIIASLIEIIYTGTYSFLVKNFLSIYQSPWMANLIPIANLFSFLCYLYAFILCGKYCQDRLSFFSLRSTKKGYKGY
jgi:hypothetical protein